MFVLYLKSEKDNGHQSHPRVKRVEVGNGLQVALVVLKNNKEMEMSFKFYLDHKLNCLILRYIHTIALTHLLDLKGVIETRVTVGLF
jgi:hypothetical protein